MTLADPVESNVGSDEQSRLSLGTVAARNLATTKSVPQMQAISPRWLLRVLPQQVFDEVVGQSEEPRARVARFEANQALPRNPHETSPREYELSVAQTVLRVHSRSHYCAAPEANNLVPITVIDLTADTIPYWEPRARSSVAIGIEDISADRVSGRTR